MSKKKNLKTYLKVYCSNLSNCSDYRLSSFFKDLNNNPRLEGPLFLYLTMFYPNELYVKTYLNDKYLKLFDDTFKEVKKTNDLYELVNSLPYEESKALKSYLIYCNENSADSDSKKAFQKRILEMLDNGVSNYKICKDNNINPGNFYAFLNGSLDRLSLKKCKQVYDYLKLNNNII